MPVPASLADLSLTAGSNYPTGGESPSSTDDYLRAHASFIRQLYDNSFSLPSGTLLDFAGTAAPTGYLLCDGSAISRTTYSALFAAVGTTWGAGDGLTTFNLPDMRRKVTVGSGGTGTTALPNTVGSTGGAETHTLSSTEMPVHNHSINVTDPGHTHTDSGHAHQEQYPSPTGAVSTIRGDAIGNLSSINGAGINTQTASANLSTSTTGITASSVSAGSGAAHNNLQPSAVVLKIIKT